MLIDTIQDIKVHIINYSNFDVKYENSTTANESKGTYNVIFKNYNKILNIGT